MIKVLLILSLIASIFPKRLLAVENNQFGVHILEPNDLIKASQLVNSNGGDWGWVTVVIPDNDMNHDKWQAFMDQCRTLHLIPIVRLATHLEGNAWAKPKIDEAKNWANFLAALNWPVKDRFVIIFNEPNQSQEFGGEIKPQDYARILLEYSSRLKENHPDFKILNAGLDLAAPNSKTTMDSFNFMTQMTQEIPEIFNVLDGWASHSYPNHGYLGKPWETGKHSIRGYLWELSVLKNDFGLEKDLPVFITETGWPKIDPKLKTKNSKKFYSDTVASEYIKYAFENVWLKDPKITAITPFVLNYPDELFFAFSWLDKQGEPYSSFQEIVNLPKTKGEPVQDFKAEVLSFVAPPFLPIETNFKTKITLKNIGQSIWGEKGQLLALATSNKNLQTTDLVLPSQTFVKPNEKITLDFEIESSSISGTYLFGWETIQTYELKVLPFSVITEVKYTFWEKIIFKIRSVFNRG